MRVYFGVSHSELGIVHESAGRLSKLVINMNNRLPGLEARYTYLASMNYMASRFHLKY